MFRREYTCSCPVLQRRHRFQEAAALQLQQDTRSRAGRCHPAVYCIRMVTPDAPWMLSPGATARMLQPSQMLTHWGQYPERSLSGM